MSTSKPTSDDPFDPANLRIDPELDISVDKPLLTVPVRRPGRAEFFRVHDGEDWQMPCLVAEYDGESYVVQRQYADPLTGVAQPVRLVAAITNRGTVFLWPVKLPADSGGPGRSWHESALKIADMATVKWSRMWSDRGLQAYAVAHPVNDLGAPKWPAHEFGDLLRIAFRDRIVDRADHPLIRALMGDL